MGISYPDVAPLLMQLDTNQVGAIFKSMEEKTAEIRSPTAWIANAALKAGASTSGAGKSGSLSVKRRGAPSGAAAQAARQAVREVDAKVRKTVGWYNNRGDLVEKISYPEVAPLLMQLDTHQVGSIFKSMESKTSEIRNPTAWIANAAKKFLA